MRAHGSPGHRALAQTWVHAAGAVRAGFEEIWAAGVLHGDIAPRNVIISEHCAPTIVDFGDAYVRREDDDPKQWAQRVAKERQSVEDMIARASR